MAGKFKPINLPPRYPRDSEICIFSDLSELDYRMVDIDGYFDDLIKLQPYETYSLDAATSFFSYLKSHLIKAFIEFERFFQSDDWTFENDNELQNDLKTVADWLWRLREFRDGRLIDVPEKVISSHDGTAYTVPARLGRLYEPATHACAEAIYIVLFMGEIHCDSATLQQFKIDLKYWLNRYYAATLEIVTHRSRVFMEPDLQRGKATRTGGKKGHEATYGTEADKKAKYKQWQCWINDAHKKHQSWSYEDIKRHVHKEHPEVSLAQLKRYTKNPKKS